MRLKFSSCLPVGLPLLDNFLIGYRAFSFSSAVKMFPTRAFPSLHRANIVRPKRGGTEPLCKSPVRFDKASSVGRRDSGVKGDCPALSFLLTSAEFNVGDSRLRAKGRFSFYSSYALMTGTLERVGEGESPATVMESYGFNRASRYKWIKAATQPRVGS